MSKKNRRKRHELTRQEGQQPSVTGTAQPEVYGPMQGVQSSHPAQQRQQQQQSLATIGQPPIATQPRVLGRRHPDAELTSLPTGRDPRVTVTKTEVKVRTGPLPDPETLAAYGEIAPNLVERIVSMAESEAAHRHEMDHRVVDLQQEVVRNSYALSKRGQIFGLLLALFFGGLSAYVTINGHPVTGGILGGATLLGLASIFVLGRRRGEQADDVATPVNDKEDGDEQAAHADQPAALARTPVESAKNGGRDAPN